MDKALKEDASKLLETITKEEEGKEVIKKEIPKLLEGLIKGKEGNEGGLEQAIPGLFRSKKKR